MNGKKVYWRAHLNQIAALALMVGLGSALFLYWAAEKDTRGVLGYEAGDGEVYPIRTGDSKKYLRELEMYGGKSAVLAEEFKSWFAGLWHGKSLAWIVAGTTLLVSTGLFYAARQRPSRGSSGARDKIRGDKNGT